jgi:DNA mismatch repair protein MutS2
LTKKRIFKKSRTCFHCAAGTKINENNLLRRCRGFGLIVNYQLLIADSQQPYKSTKGRLFPMDQKTMELLEFTTVKALLADLTYSNLGRRLAESLVPKTNLSAIRGMINETTEALAILDGAGSPPFAGLSGIDSLVEEAKTGRVLEPTGLRQIGDFMRGCRRTREFMTRRLEIAPRVAGYALGLAVYEELETEIDRCIIDDFVVDDASSALKKLRKEITRLQEKIKAKLHQIILSPEAKLLLQEPVVGYKESRPVLMVKAGQKQRLPGMVLSSSASGNTLFVEPAAVHQLGNELRATETAEQEEVYQILAGLSGEVCERVDGLEHNMEIMTQYDFAFAKAKLSRSMQGTEPGLNQTGWINLIRARHPLLTETAVPLEFQIGSDYRSLVITGPNTGGKTVALMTIGLLTLMAQSGLHIPAGPGSEIAICREVLADIGDGQNIAQSLSTFSAHIANIIDILDRCGPETLVLLDEVGTGTDPAEGAALAIAILEHLSEKGALTVASTHYPEIKQYALTKPGFKNGCMAFDRENLRPLYRLIIGQPGESNALWIAEKLGMTPGILTRARRELSRGADAGPRPVPTDIPHPDETVDQPESSAGPAANLPEPGLPPKRGPKSAPASQTVERPLQVGDLVQIPSMDEKGIVCTLPDAKGRVRVQIKGKKMEIAAKRVKLQIPADQLYPEDYDLDIVLLSKEERRLKKRIAKGKAPGIMREIRPEER